MMNGFVKSPYLGAFFSFWIGILFFLPNSVFAANSSAQFLDQKAIHAAYSEGDFEKVIATIDTFTQSNKTYSHSDSIFITKHLAVIYTANPATREMGKNYMFRLLVLLPSAKIVDMFVSDEIDRIFEKVREENIVRQESLGEPTPTHLESSQYAANKMSMRGNPEPKSEPAPVDKEKKKSLQPLYWVAGGVTLLAVGGSAIYFFQPKKSVDITYDLPK